MTEFSVNQTSSYPEREKYDFPRNGEEQASEELRLYSEPSEFRINLVGLKHMYEKTPCMQALAKYAQFAATLKTPDMTEGAGNKLNSDFYSGTLLAVHTWVAPAPDGMKSHILQTDFLPGLDDDPSADAKIDMLKEWLIDVWSGDDEDSWQKFFEDQVPGYQESALALCAHLYDGRECAPDSELDFMLGYTLASNLVRSAGATWNNPSPV